MAGGAAAAGMVAGTATGVILRGHRRPRLMGVPLPRGKEVEGGRRQAVRAGRWLYEVQTDVNLLREQAQQTRRQSPIEVLLSGLYLADAAAARPLAVRPLPTPTVCVAGGTSSGGSSRGRTCGRRCAPAARRRRRAP